MPRVMPNGFGFRLPPWIGEFLAGTQVTYATTEERTELAIELARQNVENGTGGPFGAAVFDLSEGQLIAAGVNLVVPRRCCVLHAEVVALVLAQRRLGTHDLGGVHMPACQLVCSAEPCAMCLGAVCWSGVGGVTCAARGADVEAVGFDEGPKPPSWPADLAARGITVTRDVLRSEATAVLAQYRRDGGVIYNTRGGAGKRPGT